MHKRTKLWSSLALAYGGTVAIGLGAAGVSAPAAAQQATERIEITGSLIRRIEGETALPVTTIKVEELQRAGVTNAEQAVKFITQQQGGSVSSGSVSGTNGAASYASLRNLGESRTLVLLNGKRVVNNPFASAAVDLNTLPLAAVERIETLSDGASATYGTDAIAGVINFITRRDYQGGKIGASLQIPEAGGGEVYGANLLGGIGDLASQGWNLYGTFSARQQKPMRGTEREFSKTSFIPALGFNGLSPTTFPANYSQAQGSTTVSSNPSLPGCQPISSIAAPQVSTTQCFADTQTFTATVPDQDQTSLFLKGSLALGANHTASLEYFRSMNRITSLIAPSPESGLTMFSSSPFYPVNSRLDPTRPVSIAWRTTVLGSRSGQQENNTQRLVAGLEGTFGTWDYQAAAMTSKAKVVNDFLNGYPMTQPLRNGVSGCAVPLVSGACPAGQELRVNGERLWLNPFGDQTAAGLAYMQANQVLGRVQDGEANINSVTASASTTLGTLAGGPISLAIAAEVRKEDMRYFTDVPKVSQAASSGLAGSGALREGDRDIEALALEVNLPILKNLELGASLRSDNYSDFGSTVNPKFSLRYSPTDSLVLRGSYNRGFSAPTLYNLYLPNSTTFTGNRYSDPVLCPGGVPAAGAQQSRDCNIQFQRLAGGNAQLQPEKSKAWTIGFVVQPTSAFSFGLDYWSYYIRDSVSTIGDATIFSDPARYASLYVRCSQAPEARRNAIGACQNPGSVDPLAYVIDTFQNLGDVDTNGVDVSVTWNSGSTANGRFNVALRGSYVNKYDFQVEKGGTWYDAVGGWQSRFTSAGTSGGPVIRYQQITSVGWEQNNWSATLVHRFLRGYRDQNTQTAPFTAFNVNRVDDYDVFDVSVGYRGIKGLNLSLGIQNLLDVDPPFSNQTARFQARGYDDRYHNPLGRTLQVSASYEF